MPRSGCSALHGVNPNLKQQQQQQKLVTAGLKHLANKISLNVKKTEMVILTSKQKKFEGNSRIKLCGKRL